MERSRLIVSHAGIGTILTAARFAKPIVLIPRRAALEEHRNDHQLATVAQLATRPGILVARDETELSDRIAEGLAMDVLPGQEPPTARQLNDAIAAFIEGRPI
ncbi:glycosyltransferase [Porphyrobacter sp. LM 6]|uniref:glycosyltransferase n=1 Tax=Porphyrobacter sp. LM 6 TaxID=1896196 RepID=UPI000863BC43|nr:glycosyltransferase [Porphyrobacter sp. LM 6]AOL93009.1 Glycosyltransferase family 28 C-terminal domain-containing protein [Porphyrobacter sp. LM 6]